MRFDSARAAGLDEGKADLIEDGYAQQLSEADSAVLALTDALIGIPGPMPESLQQQLRGHYSEAELAELVLGVGLFLGMSKVLISLGLEPESMPVTVIPTPGA